jgi:plastocyanin
MTTEMPTETRGTGEMREMRERAVYPILIPLAAVVLVEIIVFSLSRVLLVVNHNQATAIALALAVGIMAGSAFVAARPRISPAFVGGLLAGLVIAAIGSAAWALQQTPYAEKQAEANRPEIEVSAADLAFSTDALELAPSGTLVNFANEDTQPHNIAIYPTEEELTTALFKGEIVNGGGSRVYEVGELEPGKYYFHCDVHPTMSGDAIVEEGAGTAAHEGAHG